MLKRTIFLGAAISLMLLAQLAGEYSGTWTGTSGGGKLHLAFKGDVLQTASFTLQDEEVKAKAVSFKAEAQNVTFVFEYQVDGNSLRSRMQGVVSGKTIKGKYESAPAEGGAAVDEGTWEVTAQ